MTIRRGMAKRTDPPQGIAPVLAACMNLMPIKARDCDVTLQGLQNLIWNGALLSGGLSIVARVHARQAWKRFKAALVDTHLSGNRLYQRDWDFRYWDRVGVRAAELSILCSILWLFSRLISP